MGFCMGVRRTVDLTRAAALEADSSANATAAQVFTLGPLIHNPCVLNDLKTLGVKIINEIPPDLRGCIVIIRAHGVAPGLELHIRERGGRIIDATCPIVKKNQLTAKHFEQAGVRLFIAGEAGHAEITALSGYAPSGIVVGTSCEAECAAKKLHEAEPDAKTAIIAQTTIDEHEFHITAEKIKKYFPALEICNTICSATAERQNSLRDLLKSVDALVVAGGRESANTRHLARIAAEHGTPCILAECAADIPADFLQYRTVGLCAGASTPDSVVDEIERALV